jgi:hypothetical protein
MSQSATAEILSQFILNSKTSVSCKDLPTSSYTKNKNEMINKVINPFIKIVQDKLKRSISIHCSGTINNFLLEIELKEIKIGVITL